MKHLMVLIIAIVVPAAAMTDAGAGTMCKSSAGT
jgi:hypothetical protein